MGRQAQELERVAARIATAIFGFAQGRVGIQFHVEELRRHVIRQSGIAAPASPDRVLRAMRQAGLIDYEVISRSESLYLIKKVAPIDGVHVKLNLTELESDNDDQP